MLRRLNERTRARLLAPLPGAFGRPLRGHVHRLSPAPAFSQRPTLCSQYSATTHPHHCVCRYSVVNCYLDQSLPSSIARRMDGVNQNRMAEIEWLRRRCVLSDPTGRKEERAVCRCRLSLGAPERVHNLRHRGTVRHVSRRNRERSCSQRCFRGVRQPHTGPRCSPRC